MKAVDLAKIVIYYLNSKGDAVTPKKLQKLLFYIEAWHLVYFDKPLIDEEFEAWIHGAVVPILYQEWKNYKYNNITLLNDENDNAHELIEVILKENNITDEQYELIEAVLNKYGRLSSLELELLNHSEPPWKNARGNAGLFDRCNTVISKQSMKKYYSSLLEDEE